MKNPEPARKDEANLKIKREMYQKEKKPQEGQSRQ